MTPKIEKIFFIASIILFLCSAQLYVQLFWGLNMSGYFNRVIDFGNYGSFFSLLFLLGYVRKEKRTPTIKRTIRINFFTLLCFGIFWLVIGILLFSEGPISIH
jgi:hypothetical protein